MVKVTIEINGEVTDVLTGDYLWGAIGNESGNTRTDFGFIKGVSSEEAILLSMIHSIPQLIQSITEDTPEITDRALKALQYATEDIRCEIRASNTDH